MALERYALPAHRAGLASANFDAHRDRSKPSCAMSMATTQLWMRRWRWFFLATAGLFGYADGTEWGVSHFRMSRRLTLKCRRGCWIVQLRG